MTQIYSPPRGGKRWQIEDREAGVWVDQNMLYGCFVGFFVNESNTGWLLNRMLKVYGSVDNMKEAIAGMGNETAAIKLPLQSALNDFFGTQPLPAHTNAEPATPQGMNDVIGAYLEIVTPRPGDSAPFVCLSYEIPAACTPYPSSINQGSPLFKRLWNWLRSQPVLTSAQ